MTQLVAADDAALVTRCRDGDAGAWAALVHRYQPLVYAIARRARLDEHAAADVFQQVFARLMHHLGRIERPERLQAWIVTTAKRESLRVLRVGRRTVSITPVHDGDDRGDERGADADVADDAPLAEEALSDLQQLHALRQALDGLDGRCRALIDLLFVDDDDAVGYDEIARRLAMPLGSVGPTRARCLGKLRRLFEERA